MFETFVEDLPFLTEALINGLLFGGVLALLSLGLNLIFGVVDVVWICYAEIVMFGMYAMYWLNAVYGVPIIPAAVMAIAFCGVIGFLVHFLVISPILGSAHDPVRLPASSGDQGIHQIVHTVGTGVVDLATVEAAVY